ncbi:30S ribosomal protein S3 [uncultured archaeon]|nr:30S ribosomal protein S3 [uncultured archaeon]
MVIGRSGSNIQKLTEELATKFKIDKPQLEIKEIEKPDLDARITAKRIAAAIEKGNNPRKIANIFIKKILGSGAIGAEIVIAGKSGGGRSKTDKFIEGYLKKCGDTSERYANRSKLTAFTKPGAIGIKVRIMRELPDEIKIKHPESKEAEKPAERAPIDESKREPAPEEKAEVVEAVPAEEKKEETQKEKAEKPKKERKPRAKKEKKEEKAEEKKE